jgi:hypothetical protein
MFSNSHIVNAYLVTIHWDEQKSYLVFEEQSRSDRGCIQRGKVCVPDGKPYMNLVTLDRGAIRVIAVSRPDAEGLARGLVLTLSNSTGMHFTPASAPIVLRRLGEERPQLGFVHPGTADYELYRTQIETVMPDYGTFGMLRAAEPERRASEGFLTVVQ